MVRFDAPSPHESTGPEKYRAGSAGLAGAGRGPGRRAAPFGGLDEAAGVPVAGLRRRHDGGPDGARISKCRIFEFE